VGLFDDVEDDFTEVEEFANLDAGTYEVMVAHCGIEAKDSGNYLVITYTVTEEGKYKGLSYKEFQRIYPGRATTDAEINSRKAIKTRMLQFGIPEDRINSMEPDDVMGIEGALTLVPQRNNPDYMRVRKFAMFQSGTVPTLPVEDSAPAPAAKSSKAKLAKDPVPAGAGDPSNPYG
jgi:hypothetical protein